MTDAYMFVYTGEDARTYEGRSLFVQRGDEHPWPDGPPDYRWSEPGSDEAKAALADKEAREIAAAAEAGEAETEEGTPLPEGAAISGSVKAINDYLDGLKEADLDLYTTERDRLFAAEQEKPEADQRKGLLQGRHEPEPPPETPQDANPDGADGADLL